MHWNIHQADEDRAVSPVIGVILMVAVTVILAAVVSMLVLGLGSDVDTNPQASFSFDYDGSNNVTITHEGGDTLDASNVDISVAGSQSAWTPDADGEISAGDSDSIGTSPGDTVKVIWQGGNGDTAVLATYQVPS